MSTYQERDYDLAILVILVILCWPAALIYYFTRPMVTKYRVAPSGYAAPAQPYAAPTKYCPQCGAPMPQSSAFCPVCGKPQNQSPTA